MARGVSAEEFDRLVGQSQGTPQGQSKARGVSAIEFDRLVNTPGAVVVTEPPPAPVQAPAPEQGTSPLEPFKAANLATRQTGATLVGSGLEMLGQVGANAVDTVRAPQYFPGMTAAQAQEITAARQAMPPTQNPLIGARDIASQLWEANRPDLQMDPRLSAKQTPYLGDAPLTRKANRLATEVAGAIPFIGGVTAATAMGGPAAGGATAGVLMGVDKYDKAISEGDDPNTALQKAGVVAGLGSALFAVPVASSMAKYLPKKLWSRLLVTATHSAETGAKMMGLGGVDAAAELENIPASTEEWGDAFSKMWQGSWDHRSHFLAGAVLGIPGGLMTKIGRQQAQQKAQDALGDFIDLGEATVRPRVERPAGEVSGPSTAIATPPRRPATPEDPQFVPGPRELPAPEPTPASPVQAPAPKPKTAQELAREIFPDRPDLADMVARAAEARKTTTSEQESLEARILGADSVSAGEARVSRQEIARQERQASVFPEIPLVRPVEEDAPKPSKAKQLADQRRGFDEEPLLAQFDIESMPMDRIDAFMADEDAKTKAKERQILQSRLTPEQIAAYDELGGDSDMAWRRKAKFLDRIEDGLSEEVADASSTDMETASRYRQIESLREKLAQYTGEDYIEAMKDLELFFRIANFDDPVDTRVLKELTQRYANSGFDVETMLRKARAAYGTRILAQTGDMNDALDMVSFLDKKIGIPPAPEAPTPTQNAEFHGWQERPRGQDPIALYNIPEGGGKSTVTAETARQRGFNVPDPTTPPPASAPAATPPALDKAEDGDLAILRALDAAIEEVAPYSMEQRSQRGDAYVRGRLYDIFGIPEKVPFDPIGNPIPEDILLDDELVRLGVTRMDDVRKLVDPSDESNVRRIAEAVLAQAAVSRGKDPDAIMGQVSGLSGTQKEQAVQTSMQKARAILSRIYEKVIPPASPALPPPPSKAKQVADQRRGKGAPTPEAPQAPPAPAPRGQYSPETQAIVDVYEGSPTKTLAILRKQKAQAKKNKEPVAPEVTKAIEELTLGGKKQREQATGGQTDLFGKSETQVAPGMQTELIAEEIGQTIDVSNDSLAEWRRRVRKQGVKTPRGLSWEDLGFHETRPPARKEATRSWDQWLEEAYDLGLISDAERTDPSTLARLLRGKNFQFIPTGPEGVYVPAAKNLDPDPWDTKPTGTTESLLDIMNRVGLTETKPAPPPTPTPPPSKTKAVADQRREKKGKKAKAPSKWLGGFDAAPAAQAGDRIVIRYNDTTDAISNKETGDIYATVRTVKKRNGSTVYEVKGYSKIAGKYPDLEGLYELRPKEEAIAAAQEIAARESASPPAADRPALRADFPFEAPAPADPAAEQPPADREKLLSARQMILDNTETRGSMKDEWRRKLAEIDSLLAGEAPTPGGVASRPVFGHPDATSLYPDKYGSLIPRKASSGSSIAWRIEKAQSLLDELQEKFGTMSYWAQGKDAKKKKTAKEYFASTQSDEDAVIRESLKNETLPELSRLMKALPASPVAVRDSIRQAALDVAGGETETRVRLADLREKLPDVPREQVDAALLEMQRDGELVLYRNDDPQDLAPRDEAAKMMLGSDRRDLLYLKPEKAAEAPVRFDPSTNRHNGVQLSRGDIVRDDNGDRWTVDRNQGFVLSIEQIDNTNKRIPGKGKSVSVDPSDKSRYANLYIEDGNIFSGPTSAPEAPAPTGSIEDRFADLVRRQRAGELPPAQFTKERAKLMEEKLKPGKGKAKKPKEDPNSTPIEFGQLGAKLTIGDILLDKNGNAFRVKEVGKYFPEQKDAFKVYPHQQTVTLAPRRRDGNGWSDNSKQVDIPEMENRFRKAKPGWSGWQDPPKKKPRKRGADPNHPESGVFNVGAILDLLDAKPFVRFLHGMRENIRDMDIRRRGHINMLLRQAEAAANDLRYAYQKHLGGITAPFRRVPEDLRYRASDYMREPDWNRKQAILATFPAEMQEPLRQLRAIQDQLSQRMINEDVVSQQKAKTLRANKGSYLTRQYKIFNDPNYRFTINNAVKDRMRNLIWSQHPEFRNEPNGDIAVEQLLNEWINVGEDESGNLFWRGSTLGARNFDNLKRRHAFPKEVRDLWGEENDVIKNFTAGVAKQATQLANTRFLFDLVKAGRAGNYIFTQADVRDIVAGKAPQAKIDAYGKLVAENNLVNIADAAELHEQLKGKPAPGKFSSLGPLAETYMARDVRDSLQEIMKAQEVSPVLGTLIQINGIAKMMKTVGSASTQMLNFGSNIGFALNNGWFFYDVKGLPNRIQTALAITGTELSDRLAKDYREQAGRAIELGVLLDADVSGEIQRMVKEGRSSLLGKPAVMLAQAGERYMANQTSRRKQLTGKAAQLPLAVQYGAGKGRDVLVNIYQAGDDFWKALGWLTETAHLQDAYGLPLEQAQDMAAKRMRLFGLPYYSEAPNIVQVQRYNPISSPFLPFRAETPRILWNSEVQTKAELFQTGNIKARRMGYRRLMGQMIAYGAPVAAAYMASLYFGIDDKDDETIDKIGPVWNQDATKLVYARDREKGIVTYLNLSRSSVQAQITDPINAFVNGEDLSDGALRALLTVVDPVLQEQIGWQALRQAVENRDEFDRPVWNKSDSWPEFAYKMTKHFGKAIEPGTMDSLWRILHDDAPLEKGIAESLGLRTTTINMPKELQWRAARFQRSGEDTGADVRRALKAEDPIALAEQVQQKEEWHRKEWDLLHEAVSGVLAFGVLPQTVKKSLMDGGMSAVAASRVMNGVYKPQERSTEVKRGLVSTAPETTPVDGTGTYAGALY